MFIDQVQHARGATVLRPGADEVVAPHMVLAFRPQPHTRSIVEPQPPARLRGEALPLPSRAVRGTHGDLPELCGQLVGESRRIARPTPDQPAGRDQGA